MPQPYFLMSLLYLSLVVLSWLASILTGLEIIPMFGSLKWLRVHLVTLGALSEITFGLVPTLVASIRRQPRPKMRWDIWLSLNAGLVLLLIGIPTITHTLIATRKKAKNNTTGFNRHSYHYAHTDCHRRHFGRCGHSPAH